MPDWQKIVSEHLATLPLENLAREEVITELAGHLEETYEGLRKSGVSDAESSRQTLSSVSDWKDLQHRIYSARKENTMNNRAARVWLPSLVTLVVSLALMIPLAFVGLNPGPLTEQGWRPLIPGAAPIGHGMYVFSDYTVWLMALPLVGALGARVSNRAGGTKKLIVLSGVFPALAWLIVLVSVLSFSSVRLHNLDIITAPIGPLGVLTALVFAPAACLLIGVLAYFGLEKWLVKRAA